MLLLALTASTGAVAARKTPVAQPAPDMRVLDKYFPVRSFYVSLPGPDLADDFIGFVREDLIPGGFNNLVVRVNWNFPFKSHPELADSGAWSMEKIGELVGVCREGGVALVPMINLLGHQSWNDRLLKLLKVYPQFDERPGVKLPAPGEWKWPNPDRYYCKSYCPNHPDVHKVIFACMDEIVAAFGARDFHAGMDEVFDLASPECPRCGGLDPAEVFAGEVNRLAAHLKGDSVRLWIWADRLLDGRRDATGFGEWSASMNNTHRAIDMIDRSVVMCDWHYRAAEQSAVLFALKGYDVITCGWEQPEVTARQLEDLLRYREHSSRWSAVRYKGFMQTVWSPYAAFIEEYRAGTDAGKQRSAVRNYRELKKAFLDYAVKFSDVAEQNKDDRQVQGQ